MNIIGNQSLPDHPSPVRRRPSSRRGCLGKFCSQLVGTPPDDAHDGDAEDVAGGPSLLPPRREAAVLRRERETLRAGVQPNATPRSGGTQWGGGPLERTRQGEEPGATKGMGVGACRRTSVAATCS
ncbi:unnamed protein product [Victoria cruziana]